MKNEVPYSKLVIEKPKIELSLESKLYAGLFLLVLSFIIGVLLASFFFLEKPITLAGRNNASNKLEGTSSMKRLPLLIDRVVWDSFAYVYVKHASIRSELGIPWGVKIGLEGEK